MDRPKDSQKPSSAPPAAVKEVPPSWRSLYLILYNFVSAILWASVLGRTVAIAGLYGWRNVFLGNDEFTRWVQTAAGMEVLHSLVGAYILCLNSTSRSTTGLTSILQASSAHLSSQP